jgi:molybdenum cofactor biosynthesis enzyme MoaA
MTSTQRVCKVCEACDHLRINHRRAVWWCFYAQRDLSVTDGEAAQCSECRPQSYQGRRAVVAAGGPETEGG